jgi:hypothetical protein
MADITNKNIQIPGSNSDTNFVVERAYLLDFGINSEVAAAATHDLVNIPAGEVLVGLKVISVSAVTSGGAATVQFKIGGSAINSNTISLAGLAQGMVHSFAVANINGEGEKVLQLTVGSAAITGGKLLLVAETIPAKKFVTLG